MQTLGLTYILIVGDACCPCGDVLAGGWVRVPADGDEEPQWSSEMQLAGGYCPLLSDPPATIRVVCHPDSICQDTVTEY